MSEHLLLPDIEALEEKTAIGEFESDATQEEAEDYAAQCLGNRDAD